MTDGGAISLSETTCRGQPPGRRGTMTRKPPKGSLRKETGSVAMSPKLDQRRAERRVRGAIPGARKDQ